MLGDMKEMNSQMLLQTLSKRILEFVGDKPFRSKNYYFDEERIQGYTEVRLYQIIGVRFRGIN